MVWRHPQAPRLDPPLGGPRTGLHSVVEARGPRRRSRSPRIETTPQSPRRPSHHPTLGVVSIRAEALLRRPRLYSTTQKKPTLGGSGAPPSTEARPTSRWSSSGDRDAGASPRVSRPHPSPRADPATTPRSAWFRYAEPRSSLPRPDYSTTEDWPSSRPRPRTGPAPDRGRGLAQPRTAAEAWPSSRPRPRCGRALTPIDGRGPGRRALSPDAGRRRTARCRRRRRR